MPYRRETPRSCRRAGKNQAKRLQTGFGLQNRSGELREHLNLDYLKEILRVGKIEDEHRIESKNSRFTKAFEEHLLEIRALEFLENKHQAPLEEIANQIGISSQDASGILNGMLIDDGRPIRIGIFNHETKHLRTIMPPRTLKAGRIGAMIKKRKSYLGRWDKNGRTYYTLERPPNLPGERR